MPAPKKIVSLLWGRLWNDANAGSHEQLSGGECRQVASLAEADRRKGYVSLRREKKETKKAAESHRTRK